MTVPSGCKRNTPNKKAKDLKGNPSQRGSSFCFFSFVSGFLFVLFCSVFHSSGRFRGSVVAPCMPSPDPVSAWLWAWLLLSFVPEREMHTLSSIRVMKSPPLAWFPPLSSSCCLGTCVVQHCYHNCVTVIPATTVTCSHTHPQIPSTATLFDRRLAAGDMTQVINRT